MSKKGAREGLHLVAVLEAFKGGVVLLAGCGVLTLIHKDLHEVAVQLVRVLHLNPARRYPSIFIDAATRVTDFQLWMLALSALLYSGIRFAEAYGLWKGQKWAEWFGLLSGAVYLPVEIYEIWREPRWPRILVFTMNIVVVGFLALILKRPGRRRGR